MAAFSNYLENAILNHVLGNTAMAAPGNVYVALFTSDPTDAGTGTEVSGGAYARVEATFGTASAGSITNTADLDFGPATANWGTVTHVGIYNAATAGDLLFHTALAAPKTIDNGDALKIASGALTVSLD